MTDEQAEKLARRLVDIVDDHVDTINDPHRIKYHHIVGDIKQELLKEVNQNEKKKSRDSNGGRLGRCRIVAR